MEGNTSWGADTPISAPEPLKNPNYVQIEMGGFGFGKFGLAHNYTETHHEAYMVPFYAPVPSEEGVPFNGG